MSDENCILCQKSIPEKTKPEHILLNALGGRMTVRKVICPDCNHAQGIGPDQDLADSTAFLRNICQFEAGDGDPAPHIKGLESGDERFDLKPGMRPQTRNRNPMEVQVSEDSFDIRIEAFSDEQADKLAQGAAAKIAKNIGKSQPQVIEAIKQDILKNRSGGFRPAPSIQQQFHFGQGRSQQSMAKACLVLWAKANGNDEVNHERYNTIRAFILNGEKGADPEKLVKIDTRTLPATPEEHSDNPNIIWVGSDANGLVTGYFRLYGAIGWRFELCAEGAPPSLETCLVSNPYDNKQWNVYSSEDSPIDSEWVRAEWESYPPDYEAVQAKMAAMMAYAQELSQKDWLKQLVSKGLEKAGCTEGDEITPEHIKSFSDYVGRAVAAYLLKKEIPEN